MWQESKGERERVTRSEEAQALLYELPASNNVNVKTECANVEADVICEIVYDISI